jgi:hypothetical protein
MRPKKQLDEVSKFLETFPKLIDRPKDYKQTEDVSLKEFICSVLVHNQNVQKELMTKDSNNFEPSQLAA